MSSDPWVQVPIRLHSSKCIYWIQNVFCIQWGWLSIWTYVHFLRKHVCSCLMDRRRGSTKILGENMVNNTLAATVAVKSLQSCPTLWPQRLQPTRLPRPWDSPSKNTGVGCHFLLQCMKVKSEREVAQSCPTLSDPMDCSPPGSSIHGIFQARVLKWGAIAVSPVLIYGCLKRG